MYNETLGLKTEYMTDGGAIEAYIVDSGCMFWGGDNSAKAQREVLVYPVDVLDPIDLQKEINKQARKNYKEWKKGN